MAMKVPHNRLNGSQASTLDSGPRHIRTRPAWTLTCGSAQVHIKVDLACQLSKSDETIEDRNVLKAFDELHADIKSLLQTRKIGIGRLKRDVTKFLHPATSQNAYRQSLSLSELGYLVETCKRYSKDAPVLALYKLSGEEPNRTGALVGTYTLMRIDTSLSFPLTIRTSVRPPYLIDATEIGMLRSAHGSVDRLTARWE
jgi:hypothetical protein